MKKSLRCALFVVLLTMNASFAIASESIPTVLINEDFSKFVDGSETAPTKQDLADESTGSMPCICSRRVGRD